MQNNMQIHQSLGKKNSRRKANTYEKSSKMLGKNKAGKLDLGHVTIKLPTDIAAACLTNCFSYVQTEFFLFFVSLLSVFMEVE
jgi:hypothetical protein